MNIKKQLVIKEEDINLKELIRKRKQIIDKIQKLTKKRHFLLLDGSNKNQEDDQIEGQPRKLVKKQSSEYQPSHSKKEPQKPIQNKKENSPDPKLTIQKLQRNKRFFGGLSSHLQKAKSHIDSQKQKIEEKKKIIEKVVQKEKERNQQLLKQQLQKVNVQITQAEKEKDENSRQILKIQNLLLLSNYKAYADQLKSFIFTRTQPSISWQPVKQFDIAKKLLGEKQKQIEVRNSLMKEQSQKIQKSIKSYEEKFDYSQYLLENEREYYIGVLNEEIKSQKPFLLTKSKPQVFWKPKEMLNNLKPVSQQSKIMLLQHLSTRKKRWEDYYTSEKIKIKSKIHKEELNSEHSQVYDPRDPKLEEDE